MEERIFPSFIKGRNLMQIKDPVEKRPRLAEFGESSAQVVGKRVGARGGDIGIILEIVAGVEQAGLLEQPI